MVIGNIMAVPQTVDQLRSQSAPSVPGQLEAYQHVLYSARTYVSGTTTKLRFFDFVGDASLTNMEAAAQLPDPQFFKIHGVHFSVRRRATTVAGGPTGALDDVEQLVRSGGGTYMLWIGPKPYGPELLEVAQGLGGATGFGWGTFTAEESIEYANNGLLGSGLDMKGSLIIPPKQRFFVDVAWPAALTLTADVVVVFALSGVHFREVK
jgi:hypothetical protein